MNAALNLRNRQDLSLEKCGIAEAGALDAHCNLKERRSDQNLREIGGTNGHPS